MRASFELFTVLLIGSLVACRPAVPGGTVTATLSAEPPHSPVQFIGDPEPVELPDLSLEVTPTFPPTLPSPTQEAVKLCSPLGMHPLEELPMILSDPYDPPPPGREERHHGVDFGYYHFQDRDSMLGEPVQAVLSGKAAAVIDDLYPYGNMVIIETQHDQISQGIRVVINIAESESLYILYAHLDKPPMVGLGDQVQACQPIGEVGMSGNADIPHLHLETRLGPPGTVFISMRFYDTRASIEEMENYRLWRTSGVYRHFDPMILLVP